MNGVTYIEVNYDALWIENAIANIQGFSWLFEWGMYLFLLVSLGIMIWIFYDSITKKKDQKALVPRILSMVGFFCAIPAFIFRFVGTADGVVTLVRLGAEPGMPYYPGPINWNVGWLVAGYGTLIAIISLLGIILSIIALVIYASSVQRAKPSTEFVQAFDNRMASLESKVDNVQKSAAPAQGTNSTLSDVMASGAAAKPANASGVAATIFDRKPQAATIIDTPQTNEKIVVRDGSGKGSEFGLPAVDVVIGRDPKNFIVVDDGKVSSNHIKLIYGAGGWAILDLGSTNGTYVNGVRISGQKSLALGDEIKIGDTILVFDKIR